jgi:hypothetical protein
VEAIGRTLARREYEACRHASIVAPVPLGKAGVEPQVKTLRFHEYAGEQGGDGSALTRAWTVLIVEAAGVVLLLLTAAVQRQQRPAR